MAIGDPSARLTIAWLVPPVFKGAGGHLSIFRHIAYLSTFGYRNTIYCADFDNHFQSDLDLAEYIKKNFLDTGAEIFRGWDLRPSDAAIATHWSTAYPVHQFQGCARKLYFVLDYEPYFYARGSEQWRAEQTYHLGLSCITLGRWLTHFLREKYNADADSIDFAVESRTYHPPPAGPRPLRIAFCAQPEKPRRCFELGMAALEVVHRARPEVEIMLFGLRSQTQLPFRFPCTNLGVITPEECAALYSSSRVGLIFSASNPSLIGFEMMACGCAVVDLDLENTRFDYDSGTATLVPPQPEAVASAIIHLLEDERARRLCVERAHQMLAPRSYEQSARRFETLLLRAWTSGCVGSAPSPQAQPAPNSLPQFTTEYNLRQVITALDYPRAGLAARLAKLLLKLEHYGHWTRLHYRERGLKGVWQGIRRRLAAFF